MSRKLRQHDWSVTSRFNNKPRTRKYPWKGPDGWFNGQIWVLVPGEDFDGPAYSMERVVRTTANRQGVKVRVRVVANEESAALLASLWARVEKAKGQSMTLDKDVVSQLLALAEGSGDSVVVLQQHDDEDTARGVTKSPTRKSLDAEAPSTNGETAKAAPAKRARAKAPTKALPVKAGVSKRPAKGRTASKRPAKKVAAATA